MLPFHKRNVILLTENHSLPSQFIYFFSVWWWHGDRERFYYNKIKTHVKPDGRWTRPLLGNRVERMGWTGDSRSCPKGTVATRSWWWLSFKVWASCSNTFPCFKGSQKSAILSIWKSSNFSVLALPSPSQIPQGNPVWRLGRVHGPLTCDHIWKKMR